MNQMVFILTVQATCLWNIAESSSSRAVIWGGHRTTSVFWAYVKLSFFRWVSFGCKATSAKESTAQTQKNVSDLPPPQSNIMWTVSVTKVCESSKWAVGAQNELWEQKRDNYEKKQKQRTSTSALLGVPNVESSNMCSRKEDPLIINRFLPLLEYVGGDFFHRVQESSTF